MVEEEGMKTSEHVYQYMELCPLVNLCYRHCVMKALYDKVILRFGKPSIKLDKASYFI